MMQFPISAKKIIPHRKDMLLLDELLSSSQDFMEGRTVVKPGNIFLSSRGLDGACYVELLAQLAAAGDGYETTKSGKPVRSGFLVGVNDFRIMGKAVAGDVLSLKLRKGLQLNNFTIVEGDVYRGSDLMAQGNLKLFVMDSASSLPTEGEVSPTDIAANNEVLDQSVVHDYFRKAISGVESAGDGTVRGKSRFHDDFPGFRGHFPGYPIVPGVVLLHLVVVLSEAACSCPLILSEIERAKFSRQVLPGDTVTADLTVQRADDRFIIKAGLTVEGKPAASVAATMRKYL